MFGAFWDLELNERVRASIYAKDFKTGVCLYFVDGFNFFFFKPTEQSIITFHNKHTRMVVVLLLD